VANCCPYWFRAELLLVVGWMAIFTAWGVGVGVGKILTDGVGVGVGVIFTDSVGVGDGVIFTDGVGEWVLDLLIVQLALLLLGQKLAEVNN
jgi:hypothetical protein